MEIIERIGIVKIMTRRAENNTKLIIVAYSQARYSVVKKLKFLINRDMKISR